MVKSFDSKLGLTSEIVGEKRDYSITCNTNLPILNLSNFQTSDLGVWYS